MASDVTFEVKETAEIQKVSMKDEQAVGKIVIEKTDKVTGKPIDGVVFEVRDKDGKVLDTLTTCLLYTSCDRTSFYPYQLPLHQLS